MAKLIVIYFSGTGTTAKLADAVLAGASEVLEVAAHRILGEEIIAGRFRNEAVLKSIDDVDAVIFGSPTYMGGPAAQFKAFADATADRWGAQRWANKLAAGFTSGSCLNGDQAHTLTYFSVLAAQHGMLWCNLDIAAGHDSLGRNRLGTQSGLATQSSDGILPATDLLTGQYLGRHVALLARRFSATAPGQQG